MASTYLDGAGVVELAASELDQRLVKIFADSPLKVPQPSLAPVFVHFRLRPLEVVEDDMEMARLIVGRQCFIGLSYTVAFLGGPGRVERSWSGGRTSKERMKEMEATFPAQIAPRRLPEQFEDIYTFFVANTSPVVHARLRLAARAWSKHESVPPGRAKTLVFRLPPLEPIADMV